MLPVPVLHPSGVPDGARRAPGLEPYPLRHSVIEPLRATTPGPGSHRTYAGMRGAGSSPPLLARRRDSSSTVVCGCFASGRYRLSGPDLPVALRWLGSFLLGVPLLILGMVTLPFTRMEADEPEQSADRDPAGAPRGTTGGVLLIGPLPILFGSWKNVSPRQRWGLAILGTALLVLVVLVILLA